MIFAAPLRLKFIHDGTPLERKFSLDFTDEEAATYLSDFLREHPRRLHSLVAANPLAATRCFHWTVRLVIQTLFNCAEHPDGLLKPILTYKRNIVFT